MDDSFDFDRVIDRRGTDSLKWDKYRGRDVIPMWVADMDFQAPQPILEALHRRVEHGVFGYAVPPEELVQVVVDRMAEKYRWTIKPSWIVWMPGVVSALNVVCRAYGDDGDEVLTFTPIYPPFLSAPPLSRKSVKTIPLRRDAGRYTVDYDRFEREITDRSRILLLCNPHNPVGRRFEREELERIAADLPGPRCHPLLRRNPLRPDPRWRPAHADRHTQSRGLRPDHHPDGPEQDLQHPRSELFLRHHRERRAAGDSSTRPITESSPGTNVLGYTACLAAYRDCEPWRLALIDYLRGNEELVYRIRQRRNPRPVDGSRRGDLPGLDRHPPAGSAQSRPLLRAGRRRTVRRQSTSRGRASCD